MKVKLYKDVDTVTKTNHITYWLGDNVRTVASVEFDEVSLSIKSCLLGRSSGQQNAALTCLHVSKVHQPL